MHNCDAKPSDKEIQDIVGHDCYQKYLKFKDNNRVIQNKNLLFCSNFKCENVLDKSVDKKRKMQCNVCQLFTCADCKQPYHGTGSCTNLEEEQFKEWQATTNIQKCPSCVTNIEIVSGCKEVSCPVCHYYFCWVCGTRMDSFLHWLQLAHEPEDEVHVFLCDFLHEFFTNSIKLNGFFKFWLVILWWVIWPPVVAVCLCLGYVGSYFGVLWASF